MPTHKERIEADEALKVAADAAILASNTYHLSVAADIYKADGHALVDKDVVPMMLFMSQDGLTYSKTAVGSVSDLATEVPSGVTVDPNGSTVPA